MHGGSRNNQRAISLDGGGFVGKCAFCCSTYKGHDLCCCGSMTEWVECYCCQMPVLKGKICTGWANRIRQASREELGVLLPMISTCGTCYQPWVTQQESGLCCSKTHPETPGKVVCQLCPSIKMYSNNNTFRNHVVHTHLPTGWVSHCMSCWRIFPQTELGNVLRELHRRLYHQI